MQDLVKFFYNMEKDSLGVKIETFELTSRDDKGQEMTLALDLSGLVLPSATQ
jgi:hypothetical protein